MATAGGKFFAMSISYLNLKCKNTHMYGVMMRCSIGLITSPLTRAQRSPITSSNWWSTSNIIRNWLIHCLRQTQKKQRTWILSFILGSLGARVNVVDPPTWWSGRFVGASVPFSLKDSPYMLSQVKEESQISEITNPYTPPSIKRLK